MKCICLLIYVFWCCSNMCSCLQRNSSQPKVDKLLNYLFTSVPTFNFIKWDGLSSKCKKSGEKFVKDLYQLKPWALQMYDATAKIPSGILNGNVNQLGDFDSCLAIKSDESNLKGKYCLVVLQVDKPIEHRLLLIHKSIHSHYHLKNDLDNPGHKFPLFSSINWGICIPDDCSSNDLEIGLNSSLTDIFSGTDISFKLKIDDRTCQEAGEAKFSLESKFVLTSMIIIIISVIIASVCDALMETNKNTLITSFSISKNFKSLFHFEWKSDDVKAIHGIRSIHALLIIICHKSMYLYFEPYINRTHMNEILGSPWTSIGRSLYIYTDPFLMISGTLTAYSLVRKLQRNGRINVLEEYCSRLFRVLPNLLAVVLFCTFVLPYLGSGPLWNLIIKQECNDCEKYWWRNILFIQNYFGFKNMCLVFTHHITTDTNLFLISPFLIQFLWKSPKKGSITLIIIAGVTTFMRYYVTYSKNLSYFLHYGSTTDIVSDTADYLYHQPLYRISVYIIGILLGYYLRTNKEVKLAYGLIYVIDAVAVICLSITFIGPAHMGQLNYVYNPLDAAWHAALSPILYCLPIAWSIYKAHYGFGGIIEKCLSHKIFLFWTKISYAYYLVQVPVFFFNLGRIREARYYGNFTLLGNAEEYMSIFMITILLVLFIELPILNIRNIIFKTPVKNYKE